MGRPGFLGGCDLREGWDSCDRGNHLYPHRDRFRAEPACAVLEFAPSTYYAAEKREQVTTARDSGKECLKKGDQVLARIT